MPEAGVERSLPKWALPAVYAAFAAFNLWLSRHSEIPLVMPDETGYLGNARYIVDGNGLSGTPVEYYPGYSLFLVPAALLADAPSEYYRLAVMSNAFLMATLPVLLYLLLGHVAPAATGRQRLAAAVVASAYPSFLLFGGLATAENLFVPLFVATCLAAARAFAAGAGARALLRWAVFGVAAGSMMLVHGRAIAILLAGAMAIGWWVLRSWRDRPPSPAAPSAFSVPSPQHAGVTGPRTGTPARARGRGRGPGRDRLAPAAAWAVAVVLTVFGGIVFRHWFPKQDPLGKPNNYGLMSILRRSLGNGLFDELPGGIAGQGLYLAVATAGVFLLGVFIMSRTALRTRGEGLPLFVALATLGVWVVSSVFMNGQPRIDHLIYGRYNEGVLAPALAIGVLTLLTARWSLRTRAAAAVAAGTGVFALAAVVRVFGLRPAKAVVTTNVFAVYPIVKDATLDLVVFVVVGVVAVLLVWLVPRVGAVLLAVAFVAMSVFVSTDLLAPQSRARQNETELVSSIRFLDKVEKVRCVVYDDAPSSGWHYFAYEFYVPDLVFQMARNAPSRPRCSDMVVSGAIDFDAREPSAVLVGLENHNKQALWLLPGARQEAAVRAGRVLPPSTTQFALPTAAKRASLRLLDDAGPSLQAAPGESVELRVRVRHEGTQSGWPNLYGLIRDVGPVKLGVTVLDAGSRAMVVEGRGQLPRSVYPGESADVELEVPSAALPAGSYTVRLEMLQEGLGFFEAAPQGVIELPLVVG